MGLEDFDINFEKDTNEKDISILDNLKNEQVFNINKKDMENKPHKTITPNLTKYLNTSKKHRKPSLSNKNIPMDDLDILSNATKSFSLIPYFIIPSGSSTYSIFGL